MIVIIFIDSKPGYLKKKRYYNKLTENENKIERSTRIISNYKFEIIKAKFLIIKI